MTSVGPPTVRYRARKRTWLGRKERARAARAEILAHAYLLGMATFKHILVGTDFSDASRRAVVRARDFAKALGAKLTLLHVYAAQVDALGPAAALNERMQIGRDVHDALAELKAGAPGVDLHTEILAGGNAADALCDYAAEHDVDLIVTGSHGASGLTRLLIGSVAERVARSAPCAVLIVR